MRHGCRFECAPAGTNRPKEAGWANPRLLHFSPATSGALFCRAARHATIKTGRPAIGGRPALFGCSNQTSMTATILWLRSMMMISSPTTKHVAAPLGMDLDECRGNLHHPHAGFPACQTLGSSYNGGTCV